MSTNNITVADHLYDATAHFTNVIEFGISLQELLSDPTKMPPQGARCDFEFEGIEGDKEYTIKIEYPGYVPKEFSVQTKTDVCLEEIVLSPNTDLV